MARVEETGRRYVFLYNFFTINFKIVSLYSFYTIYFQFHQTSLRLNKDPLYFFFLRITDFAYLIKDTYPTVKTLSMHSFILCVSIFLEIAYYYVIWKETIIETIMKSLINKPLKDEKFRGFD